MNTKTYAEKSMKDLCRALLLLETPKEAEVFLEDLLTPAETAAISERWAVAVLLNKGLSYRAINEATGVSTATVTRVARCLAEGTGGYKNILKKAWS